MKTHPIIAAMHIAFDTLYTPKPYLEDVISHQIGEWAGVVYNMSSKAQNRKYKGNKDVRNHEEIIRKSVHCIQDMIFDEHVFPTQVAAATLNRSRFIKNPLQKGKGISPNKILRSCLKNYLQETTEEIIHNKNNNMESLYQSADMLDGLTKKAKNKDLFKQLENTDHNLDALWDSAKRGDQKLFLDNTMKMMETAKRIKFVPGGYNHNL